MPIDADKLTIVKYPHPVLRGKALPIAEVTDEVRAVAAKMLQLMHEAPGVGLAAPQVGLPWRMFVANATGETQDDRVFINPVLTAPSRQSDEREEGCLSLPEITGHVRRPTGITVTALGLDGLEFSLTSAELAARVWQHETDHLDGVLIVDRMAPIDRLANERRLRDLERGVA